MNLLSRVICLFLSFEGDCRWRSEEVDEQCVETLQLLDVEVGLRLLQSLQFPWNRMTEVQRADRALAHQRHQYVAERHSPEVIAQQFDVLYRSSLPPKQGE